MNDYIRIPQDLTAWGWYTETATVVVYLHLLLTMETESCQVYGIPLEAGDALCKPSKLEDELHLTRQEVRTALKHLESTGEIEIKEVNGYKIAHIEDWEEFCAD